jgi:hypothetical protein
MIALPRLPRAARQIGATRDVAAAVRPSVGVAVTVTCSASLAAAGLSNVTPTPTVSVPLPGTDALSMSPLRSHVEYRVLAEEVGVACDDSRDDRSRPTLTVPADAPCAESADADGHVGRLTRKGRGC